MHGFRLDSAQRETSAAWTIPKQRRFSVTTDPHHPHGRLPPQAEPSRVVGMVMSLKQALQANAPELRQRKDRGPPEADSGANYRQPFSRRRAGGSTVKT